MKFILGQTFKAKPLDSLAAGKEIEYTVVNIFKLCDHGTTEEKTYYSFSAGPWHYTIPEDKLSTFFKKAIVEHDIMDLIKRIK